MDANGISIHFELAGNGPSVVLLHEMGGTLESWDGIFPALSGRFRTLRYDQRGSGLTEKVRQRHHRTPAPRSRSRAAGERSPAAVPFRHRRGGHHAGADLHGELSRPDRELRVLQSFHRRLSEPGRDARGTRGAGRARGPARAIPVTLDNSWPADIGDRRPTRPIAGAIGARSRVLRVDEPLDRAAQRDAPRQGHPHAHHGRRRPFDQVRPPAASEPFARTVPNARFELIDAVHMMPAQAAGELLALLKDFLGAHAASSLPQGGVGSAGQGVNAMKSRPTESTSTTRSTGRKGAPWLVFSNSLATDLTMWDEQAAERSTAASRAALRSARPRRDRRAFRPLPRDHCCSPTRSR